MTKLDKKLDGSAPLHPFFPTHQQKLDDPLRSTHFSSSTEKIEMLFLISSRDSFGTPRIYDELKQRKQKPATAAACSL